MDKFNERVLKGYEHWAKSHTPTWETDNLVGNLLSWPRRYKPLVKNHKKIEEQSYKNLQMGFLDLFSRGKVLLRTKWFVIWWVSR
jgi:hypothetical protein